MWQWNWFGNYVIHNHHQKMLKREQGNAYRFIIAALVFFGFYSLVFVPVLKTELYSAMFFLFTGFLFINIWFFIKAVRVICGEYLWFDTQSGDLIHNGNRLCGLSELRGIKMDRDILLGNEYSPRNNTYMFHLALILPNGRRLCLMSTFNEQKCRNQLNTVSWYLNPSPTKKVKRRRKRR